MSLFELRVRMLTPAHGQGKEIRWNAVAEDGFDYAVKSKEQHQFVPFIEAFCYRLGQVAGVAHPTMATLVLPDGSRAFGSRIQPSLVSMPAELANGQRVEDFLATCCGRMSAVYAIDLFVANIDRHFGNFLFTTNSLGERAIMPIDYAHSWIRGGWPPRDIHDKKNATTNHIAIMRALGLWRHSDALLALGKVSQVTRSDVEHWIADMPSEWLPGPEADSIVTWWETEPFHDRVSKCLLSCQA